MPQSPNGQMIKSDPMSGEIKVRTSDSTLLISSSSSQLLKNYHKIIVPNNKNKDNNNNFNKDNLSQLVQLSQNNTSLVQLLQQQQQKLSLPSPSSSLSSKSLEEQVAFGFADLTNRLRFAEMGSNLRREEINQLTKEIHYLWDLIQQQQQQPQSEKTNDQHFSSANLNINSSLTQLNGK